jgi:hypothetical protein
VDRRFFGLLAAAHAQSPSSSTAGTAFDGTYAFVSAANVNETYTTRSERVRRCGAYKGPPLIILNGQARLRLAKGTVGSQGDLAIPRRPTENAAHTLTCLPPDRSPGVGALP